VNRDAAKETGVEVGPETKRLTPQVPVGAAAVNVPRADDHRKSLEQLERVIVELFAEHPLHRLAARGAVAVLEGTDNQVDVAVPLLNAPDFVGCAIGGVVVGEQDRLVACGFANAGRQDGDVVPFVKAGS